ncbi:pseudouridine synthase [Parasediminibacterium sp. JCM 36343]|uniref:pseudouridine synthase n=1 Tax=Parasediminibacterium sp. JCM 36343 TaxID=3374279 RepID=UPI00397C0B32
MAKHAFDKFMNSEPQGAKKKEMIKVEKRRAKKEAKAIGDQKRREKWEKEHGVVAPAPAAKAKRVEKTEKAPNKKFEKAQEKEATPGKKQRLNKRQFYKKDEDAPTVSNGAEKRTSPEAQKGKPADKKFSKKYITSNSDKYFKGDQVLGAKETGSRADEVDAMPLNKYIAYAGICGRREAAEMVKQGVVTVNGDVVYEPGYKVAPSDTVLLKGNKLFPKKNLVYILMNKPKDYITTSSDPEGRKTVMDLLKDATKERVYPVGRLDRNTTGVLLLTNDGELAQKLTHPGYQIKKVYAVRLDKPVTKKDFESILTGITLEDGMVQADSLAYADLKDKSEVGIEIHSGRNRIVRRIFEHLGYEVKSLDRVMFAGLTKKNVQRGTWRFLNESEIRLLKYMNKSTKKKETSNPELDTMEE